MSVRARVDSLIACLSASLLPRFAASHSGNVAVIFAIASIPLVAAMGVAVDYTRASQASSAMQDAVDAASLALSRQSNLSTMTATQVQKFGEDYFNANFHVTDVQDLVLKASYVSTGPSVIMSASAKLPTDFMGIVGTKIVPLAVSSTTIWGEAKLRVALALDNTGSMSSSNKMTALKSATHNLLTQLKGAGSVNGDVYVSIVPFVRDTNAGSSNYAASWVRWTDWEAEPSFTKPGNWAQIGPGSSCPFSKNSNGFVCTNQPATNSSAATTSTIPNSGTYKGYICPSIDSGNVSTLRSNIYYNGCYTSTTYSSKGSAATCTGHSNCSCSGHGSNTTCATISGYYEHPWVTNAHSTWNGCIMDRDQSYDTLNTAPATATTGTLFPAQQYSLCPTQLMGLSYDWTALSSKVDAMSPNGSTNQAIGLQWAWQSLTASPFTIPSMNASKVYKQIIILLSDGLNTQDRWYGDGSNTSTQVDARQQILCNNIKAAGVILYTVQVNTGGDPTSTLLQNCASSSDKFFLLTSSDQIVTTFQQIGTELSELRISQ